jgi:hypothetical protein
MIDAYGNTWTPSDDGGYRLEQPITDRVEWIAIEALAVVHRFRHGRRAIRRASEWAQSHGYDRIFTALDAAEDLEHERLRVSSPIFRFWRDGRALERWAGENA